MMTLLATPWGLLLIAFATAFFWRALGALLSGRIEVDTPLFDWCVCVTQAIVGGLMIRAIAMPSTELALAPIGDRVIATVIGVAAFTLLRGRVLPGVLIGISALAVLAHLRGI